MAPPFKKGRKPEKPEVMTDTVQATNEELRSKLMDAQTELQQERGKVRGKKVQTTKSCNNGDCTLLCV